MKLHIDLNELFTEKLEDQKVALPVVKELNDQELADVTGGWGGWGCGGCGGCGGWGWGHRRFRRFRHRRFRHRRWW